MDSIDFKSVGVLGIGIDLCDVKRVQNLLDKHSDSFIKTAFTQNEASYCSKKANPAIHYAARFAAKEAMAKALGTGFSNGITLKSLSVENDENGAPYAVLDSIAQKRVEELGGDKMLISLTHLSEYAQAFAILTKK